MKTLGLFLLLAAAVAAQFTSVPEQGRSMVVTKYGIVAAPQFLASQAGARVLEVGGNAVDAAIAANAVMGVTQPYVNGMGGDLFAIVYQAKTGKLYGLNASGWTPKALTIEYLKGSQHHQARPDFCAYDYRAGVRGGLGRAAQPFRQFAFPEAAGIRDPLCRRMGFRWPRRTRAIG